MLNCNAYDASKQINKICNCGVDFGNSKVNKYDILQYQQKRKAKEDFEKWIDNTYEILSDYFKQISRVISKGEKVDVLESEEFIEACMNKSKAEFYVDFILNANDEQKIWFYKNYRNEVKKISEKIRRS